jgi:hypothetical protein
MIKPLGESDSLIKGPKGLYLQPRDLALLAELGEFGLLPTDVIHARHFPDDKTGVAVRRRLRLLANHQLIQTVAIAVARVGKPGRLPAFHRLTTTGDDVLHHETGLRSQRPGRSEIPKPHTILHRSGMAQVALAFTDACRLNGLTLPAWHFEFDCVPGVSRTAPLSQRFLLRHDFVGGSGKTLTCWPDALCRFELTDAQRTWELAIAWEYDRSTETHRQIQQKLDAYMPWLQRQAYRHAFPSALHARVLVIVQSEGRRQNLIQSFRRHPTASIVRLTVWSSLQAPPPLTAPSWYPLDGSDPRPILGGIPMNNAISFRPECKTDD